MGFYVNKEVLSYKYLEDNKEFDIIVNYLRIYQVLNSCHLFLNYGMEKILRILKKKQ